MSISNIVFNYITSLQYKVKSLTSKLDSSESEKKYESIRAQYKRQLAAKDREIKKYKSELAKANSQIKINRENWFQVSEDVERENAKVMLKKDRKLKSLENQVLDLKKTIDKLKDEILSLKKEGYAVKGELEEERAKNHKLIARINRNHENSSKSSSKDPNRKPIFNNREKTGKKPGGQLGHKGHCRKRQIPTEVIELPTPQEYLNNPDFVPTGRTVKRQSVAIKVTPYTVEYIAKEFKNVKTGKLVYAEFPKGVVNDINYDGSVKAFAYLLNNYCNVSIDKTQEFMSELTGGALMISKGMINNLGKEFNQKSKGVQDDAFLSLASAPIINVDFTGAKVNGKNVAVVACSTPDKVAYFARENKGHKGIKDTPIELNPNILVHDHDITFYKYGSSHQECLAHVLRYLLDSKENEKNLTWSTKMRELLREMIHHRKNIDINEDLDSDKVKDFEARYVEILNLADKEYEYEPPSKYYMEGFNLNKRLRKYMDSHLLFLHDKNVPSDNNLAERCIRVFKRKQNQVMAFRSFESLDLLCKGLTIIGNLMREDSTVGYGDISPSTILGKLLSSALMLVGYGVIAFLQGL